MGAQVVESVGAKVPGREDLDPVTKQKVEISARSSTSRSFATAIRADIGESEAYKQALLRGEIGLQRPMGANVPGVDFITAVRVGATGIKEIICTDVKTSQRGKFPSPKKTIPGSWMNEVHAAMSQDRLKLRVTTTDVTGAALHSFPIPHSPAELAALEAQILQAASAPRPIRMRQLRADYSETGQGMITGW